MKYAKLCVALLLVGGMGSLCNAQDATLSAGGDASSPDGSVAWSVGQTAYTTATAANGSVAQGVQQPWEFSTVTGIERDDIGLRYRVHPNPTPGGLVLVAESLGDLSWEIHDAEGRMLRQGRAEAAETPLDLGGFAQGIYFLRVLEGGLAVKSFKIIKTN